MVRQHPRLGADQRGAGDADGELELRNPAIMLGYWGMPEETEQVLVDGWLRTGDLVQANVDGTYTFLGRKKEVIRRRGENLSPTEVEEALASHPAVLEAAVVGVASELSEEDVKAFVVLREGAAPEPAELREHAAERLTRFKVPRYLEVLDALPHTATGRVAKRQLPRELTGREWDAEPSRRRRSIRPGRARLTARATTGCVSGIGTSDAESITVSGRDLASELMGVVSFTDLAFLLVAQRLPTPGESSVLNAVLVSLADHGLTPTVLAARLTYTGAPEALQAAVAAGLLGAGSVFLGPTEDTALFLSAAVAEGALDADSPEEEVLAAAVRAVRERLAAGQRVPGLGHPVHKVTDPRVPRLYAARRGGRGCSDRTCGCCGPSPRPTRSSPASGCRSTAPAPPARRWPTSDCRPRWPVASRCWPAPPAWSGTSPRSAGSRSGGGSTRTSRTG